MLRSCGSRGNASHMKISAGVRFWGRGISHLPRRRLCGPNSASLSVADQCRTPARRNAASFSPRFSRALALAAGFPILQSFDRSTSPRFDLRLATRQLWNIKLPPSILHSRVPTHVSRRNQASTTHPQPRRTLTIDRQLSPILLSVLYCPTQRRCAGVVAVAPVRPCHSRK